MEVYMKRIVSLFLSVSLVAVAAFALVACKSSADKSSTTVYGINYSVTNDNTAGDGFLGFATVKKYVLTDEQKKAQQSQAKMMQYIMPVMMFVFALFYSAAFTLYMFVNMFFSIILNLSYTLITKKKDDLEKDRILSTTYKK